MTSARTTIVALALLLSAPAIAQDVRGLEVCTAEKDMARRTSCLQANAEFLQQELTKQARRAQKQAEDDRIAIGKDMTVLKAEIVGLKILLTKAQDEIAALRKKLDEKKDDKK
jgi:septal ring factor EnvC (AmiA/AmiB activator)